MRKAKYFLILALVFFSNTLVEAQRRENTFSVLFYNVENLFDTIDQPAIADEEFTPGSEKEWDKEKYYKKLEDLAKVIKAMPEKDLPAIIGLSEVENETVLRDLASQKDLRKGNYRWVIIEGNDPRGIDCALLYNPDQFTLKSKELIPVEDRSGNDYPLRGILHIKGKAPDDENLHIYVNHWKSRSGGVAETEDLRIFTAMALRRELDRLLSVESDPRFILMGDFNDEPTNRSIYDVLKAGNKRKNQFINDSYNLFYDLHNTKNAGSYNYQGIWQQYDQIIVSYSLLYQSSGLSTTFDSGRILKEDWMLYYNERNEEYVPNRTYGGPNYYGGISDHLPVYVVFTL